MAQPKRLTQCCICCKPEGEVTFVKGTLCCTDCHVQHHNDARKIEASKAYIQKRQAIKAAKYAKAKKAERRGAARYRIAG
jgi:hypothetical protein